jgi:transketolase
MADFEAMATTARRIRYDLVRLSHQTRAAHLGSALSAVEIVVAAYWHALRLDPQAPDDPGRDRFLLSKGHAATVLYAALAHRGFCPLAALETYAVDGGGLPEHPSRGCLPGVEIASGSLGHGLGLGAGMALAGRIQGRDYHTFVCLSDGECNEGSTWEAALFAAAQRLDRLVAIIDYNKWQATGRSDEVLALAPLAAKWAAFGWHAVEVDGHDLAALCAALDAVPHASGAPTAIVAHTVKGQGVSFMADDNNWHYRIPTADEVEAARRELGLA